MLTPEQYQAFNNAVDKFDKFIREHPEVVEKAFEEYCEQFVDFRDISLGENLNELAYHYTPKARPKFVILDETEVKRDCHKCVYEIGCTGNPVGCKSYKRDAPDGGYYG